MDIDTTIITEYKIENLEIIPCLFNECNEIFIKHNKLLNQYCITSSNPINNSLVKWELSKNSINDKELSVLKGPFGFNVIFINNKLCNIDVGLGCSWQIYGIEFESAIKEIIEFISKLLGGSTYIYIPDGYYGTFKRIDEFMKYTSIEEIEIFLIKNYVYSKPLSEIRNLILDEELENSKPDLPGYDDNGYFVKSLMK